MKITLSKFQWEHIGLRSGWMRVAKIGEEYLRAKGVPSQNIPYFAEYLDSLPDNIQKFLMNKYIIKKPTMTIEELKNIPVEIQEVKISPKMEQYVKNITDNKKEREWLKNLIQIGKVKEEDIYKIVKLFSKFRELPENNKKITDFKDDSELSKYINDNSPTKEIDTKNLPKGATLLESFNVMDSIAQLYHITTQNALDAIGTGANWCVLTENGAASYEPFDYYCFVFDGRPEILIHTSSDQIKDSYDEVLSDPYLIKSIDLYTRKYRLNTRQGDFIKYDESLTKVKEFESKANDKNFVVNKLREDIKNFRLLPPEYWDKYTAALIENLQKQNLQKNTNEDINDEDDEDDESPFNPFIDLPYGVREQIGKYMFLNNDDKLKQKMNIWLKEWLDDNIATEDLSVGRYKKVVPPALRDSNAFNEKYQEMLAIKKQYYMQRPWLAKDSKIKAIQNDPDIHDELIRLLKASIRKGKLHNLDEMPDEAKYDRETWIALLIEKPQHWDECPLEDVKYIPEILEKARQYYVEKTEKANTTYDAQLKYVPDEFKSDVLNPDIWRRKVYKNPLHVWKDCPVEEVKNDPDIIAFVKEAYKNSIVNPEQYSNVMCNWEQCPFEDVKYDHEVYQAARIDAINKIKKYPPYYKEVPSPFEDIVNDQNLWDEIFLEKPSYITDYDIPEKYKTKTAWKAALINSPYYYDKCPILEVKNDPYVVAAYVAYATNEQESSYGQTKIPYDETFKNNPELLKQYFARIKEIILKYTPNYNSFRHRESLEGMILNDTELKTAIIDHYAKNPNDLGWSVPKWISNGIAEMAKMQPQQIQNEQPKEQTKKEKQLQQMAKSRLWAAAFNDNYIGALT